jgi:hypothetical protein
VTLDETQRLELGDVGSDLALRYSNAILDEPGRDSWVSLHQAADAPLARVQEVCTEVFTEVDFGDLGGEAGLDLGVRDLGHERRIVFHPHTAEDGYDRAQGGATMAARDLSQPVTVRLDAASTTHMVAVLLAEREPLRQIFRFTILQSLASYNSLLPRGTDVAAHVFDAEPSRTGSPPIDAAYAALAAHLASRDGWQIPPWANDPSRAVNPPCYVSGLTTGYFRVEADLRTPPEFRRRGVMIGLNDLELA